METKTPIDQLNELARTHLNWMPATILGSGGPPFDISKPNFHDSKADFLKEKSIVQAVISHTQHILDQLWNVEELEKPEYKAMINRLQRRRIRAHINPNYITNLIQRLAWFSEMFLRQDSSKILCW